MSEFLVLSHTHSLLPFAHRLKKEGQKVHPIVVVRQFEAAWHGELSPSPRSGKDKGALDGTFVSQIFSQAKDESWIILTDNLNLETRAREEFGISTDRIFGRCVFQDDSPASVIRVGGWFDGEKLQNLFGAMVDRGAWHGGMGPDIDGAVTIVRIDNPEAQDLVHTIVREKTDELKSNGFRGLVQFGIDFETESGNPEVKGVSAGWPSLITHGFLSEVEDLGDLLINGPTTPLPKKFVVVLPVSRPPWPTPKARFRFQTEPIQGLTPAQMGRIFWHDVQVDQKAGELRTAGLDGLVGVARGAADTSQLALVRALEVAFRLQMPEKQFRNDAGQGVQVILGMLEEKYGILL